MNKIFLDMDGVIVNLIDAVKEATGHHWGEISNNQMWKRIKQNNPDIFLTALPMDDSSEVENIVLEFADKNGYTVEILTALPIGKSVPKAEEHKLQWLNYWFPELSKLKFNIGPEAKDKHTHSNYGDILIDDSHLNIRDWNKVGGIGIHHISAKHTRDRLISSGYRKMKIFG